MAMFLNGAFIVADDNLVINLKRLVDQEQNAGQKIFEDILKGKTDGDRTESQQGDECLPGPDRERVR